jgi:hypothetical protein
MRETRPFIRITGILAAFMTAALLCLAPITARAEDNSPIGVAVCIAKKSMNLRSEPSAKSSVVAKLPARTFVKVYAQDGKWYQVEYNGVMAWGDTSSLIYAANPATSITNTGTDQAYTMYYQGDSQWKFSRSVKKKACIMSSYAIVINNMGIAANPRFIYESNRRNTSIKSAGLTANFGVTAACALSADSPYLNRFDGEKTYVVDPGTNGVAAIKAAIDQNPEGVICYFKKGSKAHAIVACKYDGDTIYYSDAGRDFGTLLTFDDTWVSYKHRMTYANLNYIAALNPVA